ncbi:TonB-dependent receptor [Salinimonas marina]|uniref:TonB-dependent receptor n=1 Tax=Salinimonas marina TaxID=2785918 RepID=A0A7S9DVV0_9ALTE|nr:TonB-dependent receptor [Salinimonas marina]QPG04889.1 TonB-dependent receptor [Salinimonas marina]
MFKNNKLARSVQLACAIGVTSVSLFSSALANAQDAAVEKEEAVEKIQVTGSRIRSASLESPSPLQTFDASDIDAAGVANIQELLLQNPAFGSPGISRTNSNFSTSSAGVATVDLRNLGASRTLVLVNGRRYVSGVPGSSSVDLNTIPAQFIERVEILTGGASSVYGSDAVAGVVNFVLKDDFEGVEVDLKYGESAESDATERTFNITSGIGADKGNMMFHLSYSDEGAVFSRDRDRSAVDQLSNVYFTNEPEDIFNPVRPFFSSFPPQGRFDLGGTRYTFDSDNNLKDSFSTNGDADNAADGFNRSAFRTIAIPTERYLFAALGDYELSDNHSVFFEGTYASTKTQTKLEPFPFASDDIYADGLVPYEFNVTNTATGEEAFLRNPFVPDSIAGLGTDGNGDGLRDYFFAKRLAGIAARGNVAERDTYRFTVGMEGLIFDDWFYETYYIYGQTNESQVSSGQVNVQNFRYALEAVSDDLDLDADGITDEAVCIDATARSFGCVPINVWGNGSITPEAAAYVNAPGLLNTSLTQEVIGANISGDLFELPAGYVGIAAGFEYREETSRDEFDALQQAGLNAGNAIPATSGEFDVTEYYVEANVPIVEGLSARGAYRASDYSTVGSTTSYNYGLEWEVTDWLRLRAIEAQSTRAPNISELFAPPSQTFPSGLTDPCTRELTDACLAAPGVQDNVNANGGTFTLNQSDIQGISGFNLGNPNVKEEKGKSTTIGMIITPDNSGIKVLEDMSFTIDYFDIEIEDAIVSTPRQFILDQCYGGGDSSFCNFVTRRATDAGNNSAGSIEFIDSGVTNSGGFNTEGVDITSQYSTEIMNGTFRSKLAYTYLIDGETIPLPNAAADPFGGEVGASEHKWSLYLGYTYEDISVNVNTTYIGEAAIDDQFLAGFGFEPESVTIGKEVYVDLQVSYFATDNFEFYGGVDNALDNDPPAILSGIAGSDTGTETDAGTYDPIGRQYYVGVRATF